MSAYRIVQEYPHAPAKVWRALTDPALIPLWTSTGRGGRPVGFATAVGTRFQYVARPMPGWSGVVDCEVLEVREGELLRYSWVGEKKSDVTVVTYRVEALGAGTRFTWDHAGFTGLGGLVVSTMLGRVRRTMLTVGLPPVLDALDEAGDLRSDLSPGASRATAGGRP